jgi:hypothetical protein
MRIRSREAGTSLTISAHRKHLTRRAFPPHELGTATPCMSNPPAPLPPALPATTRPAAAYARASLAPATLRAYQAGWQAFSEWGDVEPTALHPDAVRQILRRRAAQAGLTVSGLERLSPHGLRAGFITEAYPCPALQNRAATA